MILSPHCPRSHAIMWYLCPLNQSMANAGANVSGYTLRSLANYGSTLFHPVFPLCILNHLEQGIGLCKAIQKLASDSSQNRGSWSALIVLKLPPSSVTTFSPHDESNGFQWTAA